MEVIMNIFTIKQELTAELNKISRTFQTDYEQAGLDSDGELGVHNDYEQGRKEALAEIQTAILTKLDSLG